jgi:hypothetical protein
LFDVMFKLFGTIFARNCYFISWDFRFHPREGGGIAELRVRLGQNVPVGRAGAHQKHARRMSCPGLLDR